MVSTDSNSRSITADVFGDLPDALINQLLIRAEAVGEKAHTHVDAQVRVSDQLRRRARQLGLVRKLPDVSDAPVETVAAVDGSLVSKRLASFDLNAATALVVDGIGPINSRNSPRHDIAIHVTNPLPYGREVTHGLMFCMEYETASVETTNVDLVMLDGAFSSGLIAVSKALISAQNYDGELYNDFFDRWTTKAAPAVPELMTSKHVIALPKRSSVNEFVSQSRLFESREIDTNGRSTASLILDANEYSGPFSFDTRIPQTWPSDMFPDFWQEVRTLFEELQIVYFKPHPWSHAYRVEMPRAVGSDEHRRHRVLDALKRQCTNPAMLEPYPLYVADRFAKSLAKGATALLDAVRSDVIAKSDNPEIAYAMLNAYRTEP